MTREGILRLLEEVAKGGSTPAKAAERLAHMPYEETEFAKIDHHRSLRVGLPEVIYSAEKTPEQVAEIFARMAAAGSAVLATRATAEHAIAVRELVPAAEYHDEARIVALRADGAEHRALERPVARLAGEQAAQQAVRGLGGAREEVADELGPPGDRPGAGDGGHLGERAVDLGHAQRGDRRGLREVAQRRPADAGAALQPVLRDKATAGRVGPGRDPARGMGPLITGGGQPRAPNAPPGRRAAPPSPASESLATALCTTVKAAEPIAVTVHFNPASLQYTVSNTLKDQGSGSKKKQYVSQTTAKLTMDLVFDTTATGEDVRETTDKMARLLQPHGPSGKQIPPLVEYGWGVYR